MRILLTALVSFLFQVQPGSIEGLVIKAANSEPLSKAIVELRPVEGDSIPFSAAITSDDGRFIFPNIKPGRYKIVVTRAGYVQREYQSDIAVKPGQQISSLRFLLIQTGAIYGRVIDRRGQPLANATVRAMKAAYSDGLRTLRTDQTAITNDLGEYRLFWLSPASYFLSAVPYGLSREHTLVEILMAGNDPKNDPSVGIGSRSVPGMEGVQVSALVRPILNKPVGLPSTNEDYVPTYFPGTTDQDRAAATDIRPGANVGSLDIIVEPVQTHHIRGVIMNGLTRQPAPRAQLRRARASALSVCASVGMNPEDCWFHVVDYDNGTFDIEQVTPGSYVLYAMENDLVAQTRVDVGDSDMDSLILTLRPGIMITGNVVPPIANVEVRLSPGPPVPARAQLAGLTLPDGTFSIRGLTPGDYNVLVSGLKGSYIKSIMSGDTDVLNRGLRVTDQSDSSLQIVLGTNPGGIEGRVLDSQGEPAANATVVLTPVAASPNRSDLYRTTRADALGLYQLKDTPPGDYRLFAWEDVEPGAWQNSDFMRAYEGRGKSIHVVEGRSDRIDTTVVP